MNSGRDPGRNADEGIGGQTIAEEAADRGQGQEQRRQGARAQGARGQGARDHDEPRRGADTSTRGLAPPGRLPVSVVVPALNAADWVESCLRSIRANRPAEIILVNGPSTDATAEIARGVADRVIDAGTMTVAQARDIGIQAATQPWIAFVDVDVVMPEEALAGLLREAAERRLDGLQAGLHSVGSNDYWSAALAQHHNEGRSRHWFGLSATLVRREVVLRNPLDETFRSGEDIEFRYRMQAQGEPVGVSEKVAVQHRFRGGYHAAAEQWLADGAGLGRLLRKYGAKALPSALMPFGAAMLGVLRGIGPGYRLVPYYLCFGLGNLVGLVQGLADSSVPLGGGRNEIAALGNAPLGDAAVRDARVGESGLGSTPTGAAASTAAPPRARGLRGRRGAAGPAGGRHRGSPEGDHPDASEVSPLARTEREGRTAGGISTLFALVLMTAALATAAVLWVVMPGAGRTFRQAPLPPIVSIVAIVAMVAVDLALGTGRETLRRRAGRLAPVAVLVAVVAFVASGIRFAGLLGLTR